MKGMQSTGETLEERLARMDKGLKRHDRDLAKLRPITMQAPAASNTHADLMSILSDNLLEKLDRTLKQAFISRNEFQVLENMIPEI